MDKFILKLCNIDEIERFDYLYTLSCTEFPPVPEIRTPQNLFKGCESNLWILIKDGRVLCDSDAAIVRVFARIASDTLPDPKLLYHSCLDGILSSKTREGLNKLILYIKEKLYEVRNGC